MLKFEKTKVMEKQQTAVEWLINEIDLNLLVTEKVRLAVQQAKQMFEEQIIDAYDNGFDRCYTTRHRPYMVAEDYGKHYYESKYGKDENKAENNS